MGAGETHPEVADLLAHRRDELPAARRRRITAHLKGCAACRRLLEEHERFVEPRPREPATSAECEDRSRDWERFLERLRDLDEKPH